MSDPWLGDSPGVGVADLDSSGEAGGEVWCCGGEFVFVILV